MRDYLYVTTEGERLSIAQLSDTTLGEVTAIIAAGDYSVEPGSPVSPAQFLERLRLEAFIRVNNLRST